MSLRRLEEQQLQLRLSRATWSGTIPKRHWFAFKCSTLYRRISTAIASLDIRSDRGRLSVIRQTRGRRKYKAIRSNKKKKKEKKRKQKPAVSPVLAADRNRSKKDSLNVQRRVDEKGGEKGKRIFLERGE